MLPVITVTGQAKMSNILDDTDRYLDGKELYGDNFAQSDINAWYRDEAEAYAELVAQRHRTYRYSYHALNEWHGFRYIRTKRFSNALGIGSAYGDEFEPLRTNIGKLTILDPSSTFKNNGFVHGVPCDYKRPLPTGDLEFDSGSFQLITSLGVMHHIPNVTHVMAECFRCLSVGGVMLLREPVHSMGDWRKPRIGLTKRERGIPIQILDNIIYNAGFRVTRRSFCIFSPLPRLLGWMPMCTYNSTLLVRLDALLCNAFIWNVRYRRVSVWRKFSPSSVFYVLEKTP